MFSFGLWQGGVVENLWTMSGPWNIMNGIAGILNIVTICGWFGIFISKDSSKDMIWPDMIWAWIIAYDLWNFAYTYNCISDHSVSYTHLDVYKRQVLATSPAFVEGGTYSLVIGGTVTGANADGHTDSGTVEGGSTTEIAASTTASGGMGGLGAGGGGMPAGQGGDVQRGMRGGAGSGFGGGAAA